ncbi:hypothetical protein BAJUN_01690 [Bajunvirus bajun]|uniref:Uncharacterized protein n=1 Tax=Brevundimonas phage vB_BgoS-Bajun TaxID=2948594 RepID=A0A9E7N4V3_9CAUD|nr:hypothetical protein BAJUN_01690 [Brevundimonas phage vB_BgoS-Bajun]
MPETVTQAEAATVPEYAEHAEPPAYAVAVWTDDVITNHGGDLPLWGLDVPVPAIGADIVVTINRCGLAYVTGYFVQDGWLGVLCTLRNPPEWHVKQNKGDPKGHAFAPEFRPAVAADLADPPVETGVARAVRLGYTVESTTDEADGVPIFRYVRPNGEPDSEWLSSLAKIWEGAGSDSFLWEMDHG